MEELFSYVLPAATNALTEKKAPYVKHTPQVPNLQKCLPCYELLKIFFFYMLSQ
jgi:hypothetical protein